MGWGGQKPPGGENRCPTHPPLKIKYGGKQQSFINAHMTNADVSNLFCGTLTKTKPEINRQKKTDFSLG